MPAVTSTTVVAGQDGRASWANAMRAELLAARPIGEIKGWSTGSAPDDYLLCQGQAVSRTTYAALFAIIGTSFGAGNGSTTFNLPSSVGRFPRGSNSPGGTGGADTINIAHVHAGPSHTHYINITTGEPDAYYDLACTACLGAATRGHHHPVTGNTNGAGDGNTSSALSSSQSIVPSYFDIGFMIRYQ